MKILVFAGTKNGRLLVELLANHQHKVYASSISNHGASLISKHENIECLVGKMTIDDIIEFIKLKHIDLVIDSTHPYAEEISMNIMKATKVSNTNTIRYERESSIANSEGIHFSDFSQALAYLEKSSGNVLFTTGVNEVYKMVEALDLNRIYVRIVPMKSSIDKAIDAGLIDKQVIQKQPPYSYEENVTHLREYNIEYLVTKDSGNEGNTKEKVMACELLGCQLIVIDRPQIEYGCVFFTSKEILEYIAR